MFATTMSSVVPMIIPCSNAMCVIRIAMFAPVSAATGEEAGKRAAHSSRAMAGRERGVSREARHAGDGMLRPRVD
jgi:hypothetical protein